MRRAVAVAESRDIWFDTPLWDAIRERAPRYYPEPWNWGMTFQDAREGIDSFGTEYGRRRDFVVMYSWALPSPGAIEAVADFAASDTIIEVGAGRGLWARLLRERDISIIATDRWPDSPSYGDVIKMPAVRAVNQHPECNVLMLCWPPYGETMAARALRAFKGEKLVYVGEPEGGCTGDDAFHRMLERGWDEVQYVPIPQWPGIHDALFLYRRRVRP